MSAPDSSIVVDGARMNSGRRDLRLDLFRGFALLTIFINHVPGTPYEEWTSRNFGFSDAAEAFFIMSGVAAALAYSRRFRPEGPGYSGIWSATAPIWSRAWTLYLVHLALTAWTIAIVVVASRYFAEPELLMRINLRAMFTDPLGTLAGIPLLSHQLGYVNILPVYAVLLMVTPLLILAALRHPLLLALGSALLWFLAGLFRLNFPNFPNPGGWFFNPFSWQAVFVTGLLIGTALSRGQRLLPVRRGWLLACVAFLLLSLVWRQVPSVGSWFNTRLWELGQLGLPFHLVGHDKTFVALPRLLHVLALTYLVCSIPAVRRLPESGWLGWLRLLGRQGLLVFSLGTLLAILFQVLMIGLEQAPWLVLGSVPVGIALLLAAAWVAERTSIARSARRVVAEQVRIPTEQEVSPPLTVAKSTKPAARIPA